MDKLTKRQEQVLDLLNNYKTKREIARELNLTIRSVEIHIANLKSNGVINHYLSQRGSFGGQSRGLAKISYGDLTEELIRLHAEGFTIDIIHKRKKYLALLKKSNRIVIDGNTILLYNDSVVIYSNTDFIEKNEDEAEVKSIEYWNRYFGKVEYNLGIDIDKDRYTNVKRFRCHYGRMQNGIAIETNKKNKKPFIVRGKDGKVRYRADKSKGLAGEMDSEHNKTGKNDSEKLGGLMNDVADGKWEIMRNTYPTLMMTMEKMPEIVAKAVRKELNEQRHPATGL